MFDTDQKTSCPLGNRDVLYCCKSCDFDDLPSELASVSGLDIHYVNIVSLPKNLEKIEDLICKLQNKIDVICISETRTNPNKKVVNIRGYNFFCNNSRTKSGGVDIYILNTLKCFKVLNIHINLVGSEDVWVEMQLASKEKFIICCVCRHPLQHYHMFAKAFGGTICDHKTSSNLCHFWQF